MGKIERIGDATRSTAIYALCEYPSWRARYVGKTVKCLHERHKAHIRAAKAGKTLPVHHWLRKQIAGGQRLAIQLLEYVPSDEDWAARESAWIAKLRIGGGLLNMTDGGEGLAGHRFSDEHRSRIAAALRTGAECLCLQCGAGFWRKRGEITRGDAKFCSRKCYAAAQIGKPKNVPTPTAAIAAAAAVRAAQVNCKRGHPLSGDNLFTTSGGSRGCKECRKLHKATYRAKGGK